MTRVNEMISIRLRVDGMTPTLSLIDFKTPFISTRVVVYATTVFYY